MSKELLDGNVGFIFTGSNDKGEFGYLNISQYLYTKDNKAVYQQRKCQLSANMVAKIRELGIDKGDWIALEGQTRIAYNKQEGTNYDDTNNPKSVIFNVTSIALKGKSRNNQSQGQGQGQPQGQPQQDNPFGNAPQNNNPFGGAPQNAPQQQNNPFANGQQNAPQQNPFGSGAPTPQEQNNPFANGQGQQPSQNSNPFGGQQPPQQNTNPFGGQQVSEDDLPF